MISILICTRNRADLLAYCLESFVTQTARQDLFEVIVIDNKSSDNTKQVTESFEGRIKNLRYVVEENIGLSYARNCGFRAALYEWVSYVDDDAKAHSNYVERALWVMENYKFDCFGGRFLPWYLDKKPNWLSEDFGLFPLLRKDVGILPAHHDAAGGVIVFRKHALEAVGGFPVNLGMRGNTVGYGEENWVQKEMRKKSFTVGFDPELKIDHLVASYKYNLKWHLKRMYAKGQADKILRSGKKSANGTVLMGRAVLTTGYRLLINLPSLIGKRKYYVQNYILDSTGYFVKTLGFISPQQK